MSYVVYNVPELRIVKEFPSARGARIALTWGAKTGIVGQVREAFSHDTHAVASVSKFRRVRRAARQATVAPAAVESNSAEVA